jgi:hypothetical protein
VTITANEAVANEAGDKSALSEAKAFLEVELADGPKSAKEIKQATNSAGLVWKTVTRAQAKLHIKPKKDGMTGGWLWALPYEPVKPTKPEFKLEDLSGKL